jgi:hypothetical protein
VYGKISISPHTGLIELEIIAVVLVIPPISNSIKASVFSITLSFSGNFSALTTDILI